MHDSDSSDPAGTATFPGIHVQAIPATDDAYGLAEGPAWDDSAVPDRRLLWVDIDTGTVLRGGLTDEVVSVRQSLVVDRSVGFVVPASDGGLLVGGTKSLFVLDGDSGEVSRTIELPVPAGSRLNDGKCDPGGRIVAGTLSLEGRSGAERLLRVEHDGRITVLDEDLTLSNGLGWSTDGTTMYSIDSIPGVVWSRPYDPVSGKVGRRTALIDLSGMGPHRGPDGMCVDAEGMLWVAIWGAGEIRRYAPTGDQVGVVTVDAPHTSSVAFAGEDLATMVITTSRSQLSAARAAKYPSSGRLFLAWPGVSGSPTVPWARS